MTQLVLAYAIQRDPEDFPVIGFVEMPVGAVPALVVPDRNGEGLALVACGDPKLPMMRHSLILNSPGSPFDLPIGKKVGAFIGTAPLGGDPILVFRLEPWPTTILEGAKMQGNG